MQQKITAKNGRGTQAGADKPTNQCDWLPSVVDRVRVDPSTKTASKLNLM